MKNIIFDLGGVFLNWNPTKVLNDFDGCKEFKEAVRKYDFFGENWDKFDKGVYTRKKLTEEFAKISGFPEEMCNRLVEDTKQSLSTIPDTVGLIQELHQKGFKLYCLSNMSDDFYEFLKPRDFFKYFDGQVISYQEKLIKPDPKIYELILDRFNLEAEETLFIDDKAENIEAAKEFGICTVHFTDVENGIEDVRKKAGLNK